MYRAGLFLFLALCLSGCSSVSSGYRILPLNEETIVRVGEKARLAGDERTELKVTEIKDDSRCPINVTCVWAGTAFATVVLRDAPVDFPTTAEARLPETKTVELNKTEETVASGARPRYQLTFVHLSPDKLAPQKIAQGDYRITLRIHKVSP